MSRTVRFESGLTRMWTADNSYLLEYKERCGAGEFVIGQELWLELENLENDLRSGQYLYDTKDAALRMKFMEGCIRLTKSPYYNKPMQLMLWQKALIETIYSFKMKETGLRRFKKIILLIARKNTKSSTCAALGLTEFFLGNAGADIVAGSNDDKQASIIYDDIDTMRVLIDPRNVDTKRNQRFLLNKITNTKAFKLSDRTRNKEGRNIDVAFLDETHEMKESDIAKAIEQSQSLKDEPLFFNLTTEGFVKDGYLDQEIEKARAVIYNENPEDPANKRLLPWFYTQDSELEVWTGNRENRLWMKSNPTVGVIKKWEYLEEQVAQARKSKADRIYVLCKDFNIKQNAAEAWLNLEDYDYESGYDLKSFKGCIALGAVDLSETTDLTCAKVLMMKAGDNKKYVLSMYFIPESKLESDITSGAKYAEWAKAGYVTVCEGNDIDLSVVADWFYSLYEKYDIKLWKCGYDQKFAKDWIRRMEFYGWQKGGEDGDLVMIQQNAQTLSNAIKLLEADLKSQLVQYGNNPVDKWCFSNAGIKVDDHQQSLIVKTETAKRIDGAVCTAILYETFRRYRNDYKTIIGGQS